MGRGDLSPPCHTHSRAPWARGFGPKPIKDAAHPWGFPWASKEDKRKVAEADAFVDFSIEVVELIQHMRLTTSNRTRVLLEHPEDLGAIAIGKIPASIWKLARLRALLLMEGFHTWVNRHCDFGVDVSKPTRWLSDIEELTAVGYTGWPEFR